MPTYEYRCAEGHEFDVFQKMSDDPLTECPECGASAERKISSGAGLVFKGSGFYITDYKKAEEKKNDSAASEKKSSSGDGGGGSGAEGTSSASKGNSGSSSGKTESSN